MVVFKHMTLKQDLLAVGGLVALLLVGGLTVTSATDVPRYTSLPESNAPVSDTGRFVISEDFVEGSTARWALDKLTVRDEREVFSTRFIYRNEDAPEENFDLRMGTAGQFYSLRTSIGELIGRQDTKPQSFSQWNDAVIQSVVTNTKDRRLTPDTCNGCNPNLRTNKNSDMNQGGTYIRDTLKKPFYSPQLRYERPSDSETRTIVWTPPSALPTTFQSGVLYDQRTKNMGNGIIEITQMITNIGPDNLENRQSIPWAVVSGTALDSYGFDNNARKFITLPHVSWEKRTLDMDRTAGWITFFNRKERLGVSFITGGEKYAYGRNSPIWRSSDYRIGDYIRKDLGGANDFILSARRSLNIGKGQTVFFRYYISIGTLPKMRSSGYMYEPYTDYGYVNYTEQTSEAEGLNNVCLLNGQRLTIDNCSDSDAIFRLYDHPIPDAAPVFALWHTKAKRWVYSNDPYAISRISKNNPGKFYDGRTRYFGMLGWAIPASDASLPADAYVKPQAISINANMSDLSGYLFRSAQNEQPLAE